MYHLDDVQLYDLSQASRLLYRDPVRLAREARLRRIPSTRVPGGALGLPTAWVDAEAGTRPQDPAALCRVWLQRLAPPSPDAHRATKPRDDLPVSDLLSADDAARRLFASPAALARMDRDAIAPSLRVDGRRCYDATLIDMLAQRGQGGIVDAVALQARREQVLAWTRYEYRTAPAPADPRPGSPRPESPRLMRVQGFETVDEE